MKKIIFLCLLSVSYCVSKPTDEGPKSASPPIQNSSAPIKNLTESSTAPIPIPIPNLGLNASAPQTAPNTKKEITEATASASPSPVTEKSSQPIDNKTSEKKEQTKENTITPTETTSPEKSSTTKTEEAVKSSVIPTNEVTTKITPTVVPKDDATARPIEGHPGFDGASFVGGIILTLGLLAIGFMGFKYHKNHTERNYHTL